MSLTLLPQAPTLPEGFCPTSWQQIFNAIAQDFNWVITGNPGFHDGESPPDDLTQLWFRRIGGFPDDWYAWVGSVGLWLALFYPPPDNRRIEMWDGAEADMWSLDGGDGNDPGAIAPTLYTGSFWEKATALSGRMPIGVGTLSPSSTVITQGDDGGADEITLDSTMLPNHRHDIGVEGSGDATDGLAGVLKTFDTNIDWNGAQVAAALGHTRYVGGTAGVTQPTPSISPYHALYFMRRTIRKYKTAT